MKQQHFADDSQLHRSSQPSDIDQAVLSVQDCVSNIKDWMTDNKLQLNDAPAFLSICQTTVTFSDSVKTLGFYMDKDLSMKQHINFICKTAFFELC